MVHNLGNSNSILNNFISEIRDKEVQKDSMRFRRNMERVGEIMAYEISKTLTFDDKKVTTPLGTCDSKVLKQYPVLSTILRAGLPFHQGFLNYFDQSECSFVSAWRKHHNSEEFDIVVEYKSSPNLEHSDLILCDPMLATGSSMLSVYEALLQNGKPRSLNIAAVIASQDALEHLKAQLPDHATIWVAAIDEELTAQSYIVPGLGDAGDLAYGEKL
ncbi:MAG: uracil phosphoribosyltransferase [Crocinitomicaceae bacterium]|nr:uracil phosphoribosyltransferase [Crocinitomicaceae bacterium]